MLDQTILSAQTPPPVATLTDADYERAAAELDCEVEVIKAVTNIEAPMGPFDSMGRPTILFERHIFSSLTNGQFDASHPDISNPIPGGYGLYSEQYGRLSRAFLLSPVCALMSASWGAFQILGTNFKQAGFDSVQDFVTAMREDDDEHLEAFVNFIKNDPTGSLLKAADEKDWVTFAVHYNGRSEAQHGYDQKLAAEYATLSAAA